MAETRRGRSKEPATDNNQSKNRHKRSSSMEARGERSPESSGTNSGVLATRLTPSPSAGYGIKKKTSLYDSTLRILKWSNLLD